MKSCLLGAVCAGVFSVITMSTQAALIDRGGGMIYDEDRNITWLADAKYAMTSGYDNDGLMTWNQATSWVGQLQYQGYGDWRLPIADWPGSITFAGYIREGEMGHLFYDELGVERQRSIFSSTDPDLNLFVNIEADTFWTSTERNANQAWHFNFNGGYQSYSDKNMSYYAWAVRDGDVSAVPVPAAAWLFGSGLLGLIGIAKRKKASQ